MESLLSLAFSNISSRETLRIRKGLRQIEGLLAQICLSTSSSGATKRLSVVYAPELSTKSLIELGDDPAFLEFYRLQDGFEWNVTTHLITCLERLLSMPPNVSNDNLLTNALYLLQGMLHLHPPSTALFNQELHMILLLDLLSPSLPPTLQAITLSTLLLVVLNNPRNARVFEKVNGLFAIAALLKGHSTADPVRVHALEMLYAYMLPDEQQHLDLSYVNDSCTDGTDGTDGMDGAYETGTMRRVPRPLGEAAEEEYFSAQYHADVAVTTDGLDEILKSDDEKEKMVSTHLGDVRYLFEAFELNGIFAGM